MVHKFIIAWGTSARFGRGCTPSSNSVKCGWTDQRRTRQDPDTMLDVTPQNPPPIVMLDLARQFLPLRQEILEAISRVCDSQQFVLGPEVQHFEAAAAVMLEVGHAAGCASGTDALWLAMAGAGIGEGDTVLTTPFSFFATVSSIMRCGAKPVLADIDPRTFNLSPEAARAVIGLRAVLPVHLYGQCADWDAFTELANDRELLLIEDAAQAFGARWRSTPAGALGDAAAFSFYPTKNLSAFGDAGLVSTRSARIDERVRMLRAHGMRRRYVHDEVGWNSRLDTIQAAVLQVKLRHLPRWNEARRAVASRYDNLLRGTGLIAEFEAAKELDGVVLPYTDPRAFHVFHQYVIRAPRRDALRTFLAEQRIGTEVYYPLPLHLQTSLAGLGYKAGDFPVSERAAAEVLALPIYPELREDEQGRVVGAIREFYAGRSA